MFVISICIGATENASAQKRKYQRWNTQVRRKNMSEMSTAGGKHKYRTETGWAILTQIWQGNNCSDHGRFRRC